jgi:hypothetical protein
VLILGVEELKGKSGKWKAKMGRLTQEFRDRTKHFAAQVIRLFVKLPKEREEVRV